MTSVISTSTRERIITVLRAEVSAVPQDVRDDTPLAQFGLNSMKQVDVLFGLEDEFEVQIDENDLKDNAFESVGTMTELVEGVCRG
ncbi:acyl carrier protein [Actinoplanes philippinensis]|uniref:acyl carrier protein n=1 Tax=Actinoplanes philippinensis TaxID=35752 RepID=UPI0033FB8DD7